ncbi:MAG: hypothetical protein BHV96_02330 [Clostridium sp. CAG:354_28_25]|nr:MAG: hypothetical protein BHV96_02330 [Clostridium sp. CAG:354_28_25]
MRANFFGSTACYLKKDNKILYIKFNKKWGQVYAPIGGKIEAGETPTECLLREFKEETGLELKDPKLKGISFWKDSTEGIIFIYTAENVDGNLQESEEGRLEWIDIRELDNIKQFDMNSKFTKYIFEEGMFEGKFILDENAKVLDYKIRKI